jgi:hypothetical protein
MNRNLLLLFALALLTPPTAGANPEKAKPLLFCVSYAPGFSSLFIKQADSRYQDIALSTANVIELAAAPIEKGTISLYGPAGDDGKHALAATVELVGTAAPLIVLNPAAAGANPPYTATVVDAAPAKFPLGSYHVVNLSPHLVRINRDKTTVEIPAAGAHVYQAKSDDGAPLAITIDYKPENEWLLLSSSNWASRDDRRTLVCIVEDPSSKRMVIKSIPLRPFSNP